MLSIICAVTYFSILFSPKSWTEFVEDGSRLVGFRRRASFNNSKPEMPVTGDVLFCYVTGIQRWSGAVEVLGPSQDKRTLWSEGDFPVRLDVRPLIVFDAEHGIHMRDLLGRVAFYAVPADAGGYHGFVRSSPNRFRRQSDGTLLLGLLAARAKV